MQKLKQKIQGKMLSYLLLLAGIVLVLFIIIWNVPAFSKKSQTKVINQSTLEKIINVSDLSTFEAVYNGIAKVQNQENPEKTDYYVSYDAKVKAGIDFEEVSIAIDEEEKIIVVELPEIRIIDINVDITSLDYIFQNDKANTATVSEEAYKKCIEDATNETNSETAIYELAEQNAKNMIEALLRPFIEQFDNEYQLQIG